MSVKLIAVDMDGTFLSDAKIYNRPRFLAQYAPYEGARHSLRGRQRQPVLPADLLFPGDCA